MFNYLPYPQLCHKTEMTCQEQKHSSLFCRFVGDEGKKSFYAIDTRNVAPQCSLRNKTLKQMDLRISIENYLAERHFTDRHLANRHFADRRLLDAAVSKSFGRQSSGRRVSFYHICVDQISVGQIVFDQKT
jgi:hypothetical protein